MKRIPIKILSNCLSVIYQPNNRKMVIRGFCGFILSINMTFTIAQISPDYLEKLSIDFLKSARREQSTLSFITSLSKEGIDVSLMSLEDEHVKATIWINLYNAFVIELLKNNKSLYDHRSKFFKSKLIRIGKRTLSLNDIEHGLLRKSSIWWSQGYLTKLFPSSWEKKSRMKKLDWRIHFALNCGAISCPPIAAYNSSLLDQQLRLATKNYLQQCTINTSKKEIWMPKLFFWYKGDFGGKKGIMHILKEYKIIDQSHKDYKIRYLDYDWTLTSLTE
jgi:hypothetical protein